MQSVADAIRLNARRSPNGDAVVDDTGRWSHRQLAERSWALARRLHALGVRPGDPVGTLARNGRFVAEAFLGTAAAGAVHVPYNWRWATPELVHGIRQTEARVLLVGRDCAGDVAAAVETGELERVEHVLMEGAEYEAALEPGPAPDLAVAPDDPLCVLFTGGTTGFSKGVVLSQRAAFTNAYNEIMDCAVAREPDDRALLTTPMFHSAALLCWFLPHYLRGAANVMLNGFDEEHVAWLVERERVTNFFMIPNMVRRMVKAGAFETPGFQQYFRALHSGGGTMRLPDKQAVLDLLPDVDLYFRYGLTEAGPMVTRLQPQDVLRPEVDDSIGKEYLLTEVTIRDPEGHELYTGEVGEICVRGPGLMTGYYGQPAETARALRDGWLHTGDLAMRDDDGFVFFRDRAKDMVKSGGENVYCAEIEQVLYAHPAVMEAGVLGVPSTEWDEEVRAVVSVRPGHQVAEAELRAHLRSRLAGYKVPKQLAFLPPEKMPINPSGKVVKSELRELLGW